MGALEKHMFGIYGNSDTWQQCTHAHSNYVTLINDTVGLHKPVVALTIYQLKIQFTTYYTTRKYVAQFNWLQVQINI